MATFQLEAVLAGGSHGWSVVENRPWQTHAMVYSERERLNAGSGTHVELG